MEQSTREIVRRSGARIRVRNISRQGVGFPDLVLLRARDRRLIFAELKRERDQRHHGAYLEEAQKEWLEDLRALVTSGGPDDSCPRCHHAGHHDCTACWKAEPWGPCAERVPRLEVFVWRPSDFNTVEETLR